MTQYKGKLMIITDIEDKHIVLYQPVNGTIWLTKPELAELFGVFIPTITSQLKNIYDSGCFRYEDTSIYSLQATRKQIVYEATEFNLSIIIALAFRINSWQAKLIREWVIRKVVRGHFCLNYSIIDNSQNINLN